MRHVLIALVLTGICGLGMIEVVNAVELKQSTVLAVLNK